MCVCVRVYFSQNSSDDDTVSSVSQEHFNRGRRDSVVSWRDCSVLNLWLLCRSSFIVPLYRVSDNYDKVSPVIDFILYFIIFLCNDFTLWRFSVLRHVCCEQSSDFSDISESAADYFSRSNRRGSIVSDLDDLSIPDLDTVSDLNKAVWWLMQCSIGDGWITW